MKKNHSQFILSLVLSFSIFAVSLPQTGYAQTSSVAARTSTDWRQNLRTIEEKIEKRRQELGIPGMSLVVVKDGEVVLMKGFGYKDFEGKIPVTPDTQFAIGSATKAFTSLSVLMSADEGKLNLDESPKKYLPYFKMFDPETDKNMTVRDLMAHTSGLNRTDLAMITGRLTRQELIQVAGLAKPMAKLRERWFYQNIMFAAAGETVARVQKMPWERFVPERILKPLGMTNSTMSMAEMQKAKDYSFGYEYNFDTKETRRLPFREIAEVAPAGSINSSARDMAKWITFVMNGGAIGDRRLVSEKGFDEWTKKQMNITPDGRMAYGLGWFLRQWNGMKVVEHGGNIDGFNSLVAMIPEKKIGFVMLTNVSGSPLGNELMPIVWESILGDPNAVANNNQAAVAPEKEVGKYNFAQAGFDVEVKMQDGKLAAVVPDQPVYTLENVGGRRYKLTGAPEGFFITFKENELYLEQPQGNFTLPKVKTAQSASTGEAAKELVGKYLTPNGGGTIEVKSETDGRVTLNITGQQPYALGEKGKDNYSLAPLPEAYSLKVRRDAENKVQSIVIAQPEGEFEFKKTDGKSENKPAITLDELLAKTVEAAGGEANLRRLKSRVMTIEMDLINQGVKGTATVYSKFPNKSATETTMTALGKTIAKGFDFFDGTRGEEVYTFAPVERYAGKKLEDMRLAADFYAPLNWKTNYSKIEVKGIEKCGAEEECYVVEFTPEKGTKMTDLYSTKTFLLMKRRGTVASSTSDISIPYSITYSDYRDVDGVKLPFRMVNASPTMGEVISVVTSVKQNAPVEDSVFAPRSLELK